VHSFKDFKATDPRDKIYALLGISRSNSHNIEPDYTSSTSGVYASIVRSGMLLQLKTFVVFSMVQVHDEEPDEEFPSWVPRLDRELRIEGILSHYMDDFGWNASKGSSIDVLDVEDENCLVLRGLRISQIDFTSDVLHRRPWEQEDFDAVWQITKRRLGPYYNNTSELAQAFVHTITIGKEKFLEAEGNPAEGIFDPEICDYFESDIRADSNFFITDKGQMGLGCTFAREGDILCVIFGFELPFLLRKWGDNYRYLEMPYVRGIMHGEAMEDMRAGELTEEWFSLR
jgi:hypothetical protein